MKPHAWVVAFLLLVGTPPAPVAAASSDGTAVTCQLPPQIRRLGRNTTYLAAGRIVQTTAADCRVRGGKAKASTEEVAPAPGPSRSDGGMAVMVGGDGNAAACPVSGEIIGLKAGSTLTVRAGPSTGHDRLDRLANGRRVFVCDGTADEAWLGIVYPVQAGQDCAVSAPIKRAAAYAGGCRVGWVNAGWVRTDASRP